MRKQFFAFTTISLILTGCTTQLEVGRGNPAVASSRRGIAYFLPFTQFENAITWSIACDKAGAASLVPKVESTAKAARDPSEVYVIDYTSLDAWTKTSSVKVDFYDSGAIRAINASADDRTAEIAGKALTAIGKVAKFAAVGGDDSTVPECSKYALDSLKDVGTAKDKVAKLTNRLTAETASLDALTARVLRSGDSTSESVRRSHDRLIGQVAGTQFELERAKAELVGTLESVTYEDTIVFPETSDAFESANPAKVPDKQLQKWLNPLSPTKRDAFADLFTLYFQLSSLRGWEKGVGYDDASVSTKESRRAGLRYRVGVPGTLSVCQGAKCSDDLATTKEIIAELPINILQRGTTFYLPFSSAPFTNAGLNATFTEGGVLTSAGYEQKRAKGEAVAGLADLLADQIVTVGGAVRDAKTTKLDKLKEQTELAKARKDLADAEKALVVAPKSEAAAKLEALAASTELKRAELADIEAETAIRKARAERDAQSDGG